MAKLNMKKEWMEWSKLIIITVLAALFLRTFVFATSIVEGESMDPTVENGERVMINKLAYWIGEPKRGDIVIIQRPTKNYVKRIIAMPGETIEVRKHLLYIDNEQISQQLIQEDAMEHTGDFGPTVVPDESYFVMGDNRAISKDSRNGLGFVDKDNIIGKSEFIIFPFDRWSFTR